MQPTQRTEQTPRQRVVFVVREAHIEPLEVGSAGCAMLWGLLVAYPYVNTFDVSITFRVLAQLLPETWCGALVFLAGLIQLCCWLWAPKRVRRNVTFAVGLLWLFLWISFVFGFFFTTSTAMYLLPIYCCALAFYRLFEHVRQGIV